MKHHPTIRLSGFLVLFSCVIIVGLWFNSDKDAAVMDSPVAHQITSEKEPVAQIQQSDQPETLATSAPVQQQEEASESEENPFFEAETKARLIQIADTFEEDIQYPVYSKPILNKEELQKYLPNISAASSLPVDTKNPDSPRINLKTSKLQYFRGEPIKAQAYVDGLNLPESIEVSARLVMDGESLAQEQGESVANQANRFLITIDSNQIPASLASNELRLIAEFDLDGARYEIGAPIQYLNAAAEIDYVGTAQVVESVLQIPVYITTSQPGYHHLSAILFDAQTGAPLVHLNAEKELLVERDFIPLQAHIAALKAAGHEGPYLLKNFSLVRQPSAPDFTTQYGKVPAQAVQVNGFSFSEYRDEPYIDHEAQARLEFLKKLGGGV